MMWMNLNQEIDRGLPIEQDDKSEDKSPITVKSGDLDKKPNSQPKL